RKTYALRNAAQQSIWTALPFGSQKPDVITNRQTCIAEQRFHRDLVHSAGRSQRAATHERHGGHFQQTLNRAVFAEGSVEHRKHGVERFKRTALPVQLNQTIARWFG